MSTPNDGFGCVKVDLVFQLVPSYSFTFTAPVDDLGKTYGFLRRKVGWIFVADCVF